MKITKETLIENGWKKTTLPVEYDQDFYSKWVEYKGLKFKLDIQPFSNTPGRDWFVHVDNDCCDSVASLDVSTFEQIDKLLDLCIYGNEEDNE